MNRTLASALPVWIAVIVGVVITLAAAPETLWIPAVSVIAAGAVLLTFVIQVSMQTAEGLVTRMLVTLSGVVLIAGATSGLMLIIAGVR